MTRVWIIIVGVLLVVGAIPGCMSPSQDLLSESSMRLEYSHQDSKVRALAFSVKKENQGLIITGVLRQIRRTGMPIRAHVHITVKSSDGRAIIERTTSDMYVRRNRIGGGSSYRTRFTVRLDTMPPSDSIIQIVAHEGMHVEEHS